MQKLEYDFFLIIKNQKGFIFYCKLIINNDFLWIICLITVIRQPKNGNNITIFGLHVYVYYVQVVSRTVFIWLYAGYVSNWVYLIMCMFKMSRITSCVSNLVSDSTTT